MQLFWFLSQMKEQQNKWIRKKWNQSGKLEHKFQILNHVQNLWSCTIQNWLQPIQGQGKSHTFHSSLLFKLIIFYMFMLSSGSFVLNTLRAMKSRNNKTIPVLSKFLKSSKYVVYRSAVRMNTCEVNNITMVLGFPVIQKRVLFKCSKIEYY